MEISAAAIPQVQMQAPVPQEPIKVPKKEKLHKPETLRTYYVGRLQIARIEKFYDVHGNTKLMLATPEGTVPVATIEAGDMILLEHLKALPRPSPIPTEDRLVNYEIHFQIEPTVTVVYATEGDDT